MKISTSMFFSLLTFSILCFFSITDFNDPTSGENCTIFIFHDGDYDTSHYSSVSQPRFGNYYTTDTHKIHIVSPSFMICDYHNYAYDDFNPNRMGNKSWYELLYLENLIIYMEANVVALAFFCISLFFALFSIFNSIVSWRTP